MTGHQRIIRDRVEVRDAGYKSPCWLWGLSTRDGYGRVTIAGRQFEAHRIAFSAWRGPIPHGLVLDHLCRNRACANPDHLEPVSNRENVRRGSNADHAVRRDPITHCPHGHEYTPANSYFCRRGTRSCRACRRARSGSVTSAPGEGLVR